MSSDVSKMTLMVGAFIVGLAVFVAGFVIAMEIRSAVASPSDAPAMANTLTCWNVQDLTQQTGDATCAGEAAICVSGFDGLCSIYSGDYAQNCATTPFAFQNCWRCCESLDGAAAPVGGVAQYPNVAGTGGSGGYNVAAAIGVVAAALVVVTAGAWYARRRWVG